MARAFQTVREVTRPWFHTLDVEVLCSLIPSTLTEVCGAEKACLCMRSVNGPYWAPRGFSGLNDEDVKRLAERMEHVDWQRLSSAADWRKLTTDWSTGTPLDTLCLEVQGDLFGLLLFAGDLSPELVKQIADDATLVLVNALRVDDWRSEMRGLSFVADLNKEVELEGDLQSVLGKVVNRVSSLVLADGGGVMLYDPELDGLVLHKPAFGILDDDLIGEYRMPLRNYANACRVFSEQKAYICNDCAADPRLIKRFVDLYGVRNLIAVPLSKNGKAIGVLNVVNKISGDFTPRDAEILQLVADHLAALIENALLMEAMKQRTAELERLNGVIREQHEELKAILEIHTDLNQRALTGLGVKGVAERVARTVHRDVRVIDPFGDVIYSTGRAGIWRAVEANIPPGSREHSATDLANLGCEVSEITAGHQVLGYLLVSRADSVLSRIHSLTVDYATTVLALELMKQRAMYELSQRLRSEFVNDLLSGAVQRSELEAHSLRLKHDITVPHWILAIEARQPDGHHRLAGGCVDHTTMAAAIERVEKRARTQAPDALVAPKGKGFVVLLPSPDEPTNDVARLASKVCTEIEDVLRAPCVVGISSLCCSLPGFPKAWREATMAARMVGRLHPGQRVQAYADLGVYRLLAESGQSEAVRDFCLDLLGPLLEYERNHPPVLSQTLSAYLHCEGNLKDTSELLHIHVNTLRYRLGRLEEVLSLNLRDRSRKLELQLALKGLALYDVEG